MMGYDNYKMQLLLLLCFGLVVASIVIKHWRRKQKNPVTRKLTRSWRRAAMSFGLIGLVLAASRAEDISYISMRFWWVLWLCAFAFYAYVQVRIFRARHYEKLPTEKTEDPRDRYLPNRKKRR
jgi:tellurite resistance protein TehA-like permease